MFCVKQVLSALDIVHEARVGCRRESCDACRAILQGSGGLVELVWVQHHLVVSVCLCQLVLVDQVKPL